MTQRIQGIDVSNWSGTVTPAQIDCLKRQGITWAGVGSSFGLVAGQQMAAFEGAGFKVVEYMFPGHVHDTNREWWLDVEQSPGTLVNEQTVRAAIDNASNKPRGIYANRTSWLDCIGWDWLIKGDYQWLKCWDANYGPLPRPFNAFGGFTIEDRIISQYAGTTKLCDLSVDLDEIYEQGAPVIEEEDMPKLVICREDSKTYLVGYTKPIWLTDDEEVKSLTAAYGKPATVTRATLDQMTA